MMIKRPPAGVVIRAQPAAGQKPPSGTDWVREPSRQDSRIMSAGTAAHARPYSRNATGRAIGGVTAELIKANNSTIDGDSCARAAGLSRLEELSRREAARTAMPYAFDQIEHEGEDPRNLSFPDRRVALARLLRDSEKGSSTRMSPTMGRLCFIRPAGAAGLLVFSRTWVPELEQP